MFSSILFRVAVKETSLTLFSKTVNGYIMSLLTESVSEVDI